MKKEIDELILVESYFFQFNYLFVSVSSWYTFGVIWRREGF